MSKEKMFFDTESNLADQLQGALLQVKIEQEKNKNYAEEVERDIRKIKF